jgi:hypothetical protein
MAPHRKLSDIVRHRLLISVRSILLGWAALFGITYLVERPLIFLTAQFLGAHWVPTEQLALTCLGLVATGWIIGRWNRLDGMASALIFAAMLAVWNFDLVPINLSWLYRLILDSFQDVRVLEPMLTSLVTHTFLLGSLLAGAGLSRPAQRPVSIAPNRTDHLA